MLLTQDKLNWGWKHSIQVRTDQILVTNSGVVYIYQGTNADGYIVLEHGREGWEWLSVDTLPELFARGWKFL